VVDVLVAINGIQKTRRALEASRMLKGLRIRVTAVDDMITKKALLWKQSHQICSTVFSKRPSLRVTQHKGNSESGITEAAEDPEKELCTYQYVHFGTAFKVVYVECWITPLWFELNKERTKTCQDLSE
jgi:hypothetical protein